jgi:DNA (cytosine-5)-methyltransferase 1
LFSGAGGLSLGAARAGFSVAAVAENDRHAIETHTLNFPGTKHYDINLSETDPPEFTEFLKNDGIEEVSGVIGGPPCQGFSMIGHRAVDDDRSCLFVKFFQLVSAIQPDFFVAENVPGIMAKKFEPTRDYALSFVSDYTILETLTVNASEFGAPTTRTRVFFIGYKHKKLNGLSKIHFNELKVSPPNVKDALLGLPSYIRYSKDHSGKRMMDLGYINNKKYEEHFFHSRVFGHIPNGIGNENTLVDYFQHGIVSGCFPTKHSEIVRNRYKKVKCGENDSVSKSKRLSPDGLCPTLRAGTGPDRGSFQAVRPIHYHYPRVITPREAARLQGFPDWFVFQPTIWHSFRQIGNSVSPLVAERILSAIHQKLTS